MKKERKQGKKAIDSHDIRDFFSPNHKSTDNISVTPNDMLTVASTSTTNESKIESIDDVSLASESDEIGGETDIVNPMKGKKVPYTEKRNFFSPPTPRNYQQLFGKTIRDSIIDRSMNFDLTNEDDDWDDLPPRPERRTSYREPLPCFTENSSLPSKALNFDKETGSSPKNRSPSTLNTDKTVPSRRKKGKLLTEVDLFDENSTDSRNVQTYQNRNLEQTEMAPDAVDHAGASSTQNLKTQRVGKGSAGPRNSKPSQKKDQIKKSKPVSSPELEKSMALLSGIAMSRQREIKETRDLPTKSEAASANKAKTPKDVKKCTGPRNPKLQKYESTKSQKPVSSPELEKSMALLSGIVKDTFDFNARVTPLPTSKFYFSEDDDDFEATPELPSKKRSKKSVTPTGLASMEKKILSKRELARKRTAKQLADIMEPIEKELEGTSDSEDDSKSGEHEEFYSNVLALPFLETPEEEAEIAESISCMTSLKNLTPAQVVYIMKKNRDFLQGICDGTEESWRHHVFHSEEASEIRTLDDHFPYPILRKAMNTFIEDNFVHIAARINLKVPQHKYYVPRVLFPELYATLFREVHKLPTQQDAWDGIHKIWSPVEESFHFPSDIQFDLSAISSQMP